MDYIYGHNLTSCSIFDTHAAQIAVFLTVSGCDNLIHSNVLEAIDPLSKV
jgi:hypothetical protein